MIAPSSYIFIFKLLPPEGRVSEVWEHPNTRGSFSRPHKCASRYSCSPPTTETFKDWIDATVQPSITSLSRVPRLLAPAGSRHASTRARYSHRKPLVSTECNWGCYLWRHNHLTVVPITEPPDAVQFRIFALPLHFLLLRLKIICLNKYIQRPDQCNCGVFTQEWRHRVSLAQCCHLAPLPTIYGRLHERFRKHGRKRGAQLQKTALAVQILCSRLNSDNYKVLKLLWWVKTFWTVRRCHNRISLLPQSRLPVYNCVSHTPLELLLSITFIIIIIIIITLIQGIYSNISESNHATAILLVTVY